MTTVSHSGAVGLIGLGEIGQVHAAAIRRVPAARLAAVADTAAERLRPFAAEGVRAVGYRTGPALAMFREGRWSQVPVRDDDWQASVQASVTAYLDAVIAGREPPVTGAAALETMRLLDRIYDAAVIL